MKAYFKYRSPIDVTSFNYSRASNRSEIILTGKFFNQIGEFREELESKSSALAVLKHLIDKKFPNSHIESYSSESVGASVHALSLSTIILSINGKHVQGQGEDQDIEISAMKALINAVNNAFIEINYKK